ncbi:MAG: MoaD/ThiS family protein [Rhodospirillaceae bacterium]
MKVTLKLYAALGQYLPPQAHKNEVDLDVEPGTTAADLLMRYNVPEGMCHLVLINGNFVPPSARETLTLQEGDALAAWPPVAGG